MDAGFGQVEGGVDLVGQALEAGQAVAFGSCDHGNVEFGVGEVGLVAAEVEVEAAGSGYWSGDSVGGGLGAGRYAYADGFGRGRSRCRE